MKHFMRWISPLILGMVEFYSLRLATDPSRKTEWWPDFNNQIRALTLTILLCYVTDYILRYFFHKYIFKREVSAGKEYTCILLGLFALTNIPLSAFYATGIIELGQPISDYLLVNIIYVPINTLYYMIIRNKENANYYHQQKLQLEKLRNEQLDTELKLLKSQYHPHFLFNALNTIYFQIDDGNVQAKQSVEILSELLRYQLYDINQTVTIAQDVSHLKAYIRFQRLRMSERLILTEEYDLYNKSQKLHPLLFQPLAENAFKYVSGEQRIHFSLKQTENSLVFTAENSINRQITALSKQTNGLGVENLKKRLQILYPDKHQLKIDNKENNFHVELTLKLTPHENKVCHNR